MVELIYGTDGADVLVGTEQDDHIFGARGAVMISAGLAAMTASMKSDRGTIRLMAVPVMIIFMQVSVTTRCLAGRAMTNLMAARGPMSLMAAPAAMKFDFPIQMTRPRKASSSILPPALVWAAMRMATAIAISKISQTADEPHHYCRGSFFYGAVSFKDKALLSVRSFGKGRQNPVFSGPIAHNP